MGGYPKQTLFWNTETNVRVTVEQLWEFLEATESASSLEPLRGLNEALLLDLYGDACFRWRYHKLFDRFADQTVKWQAPQFIGRR